MVVDNPKKIKYHESSIGNLIPGDEIMTQEQMTARLHSVFPQSEIQVVDLTGTEDHWEVHIKSKRFEGLNRMEQHKLVMDAFAEELKTGEVHALTMKTKSL